ncbi:hypothetical protein SAMN05216603_105184 [Pseudomonas benzenivorans]|nr:DUF6190 family protein [Pseudomonas benzenivorans]SDH03192.1 hypothetical protein SAMN05216603_105184 [Pseudomonas benzenivorans]
MAEVVPFIDASVFLGMHHANDLIRRRSLAFFRSHFERRARMNFEQVGICDAIIWRQPRRVQDVYYPFMDLLHSDMQILREGYAFAELELARNHRQLQELRPEQALLAAQVLLSAAGTLFTHDPALLALPCLASCLGDFDSLAAQGAFPGELQDLYQASRAFILTDKDWQHVETRHLCSLDHTA